MSNWVTAAEYESTELAEALEMREDARRDRVHYENESYWFSQSDPKDHQFSQDRG